MGKDSRTALFRTLQSVFEDHLFRHFRWGGPELMILPGERVLPEKGKPKPRRNQLREVVKVRINGRYEIEAQSPEECPPLGRISLRALDGLARPDGADLVDGPLDVSVFAQIGKKFDELQTVRV